MRIGDYLTRYEIEDVKGVLYAVLVAVVVIAVFVTVSEIGRETIAVCGVIQ